MTVGDRIMQWLREPIHSAPPAPAPAPSPAPAQPSAVQVASDAPVDAARLRAQLEMHEGIRLRIYTDTVGKVSVGIGRNLTDKGVRADEAALMLDNDIAESVAELDRVLPWWRGLDEIRRRVMVDMMFNMGAPTLMEFSRTLGAIQSGRYREAAEGMLASKWAQQTGARARRLAAMMGSGRDWVS